MATKAISDFLIPLYIPLNNPVTITLSQDLNPNEFFQTRSGLKVSGDFRRLVVAKARSSKAGTSCRLNRARLAKIVIDIKVESKSILPAYYIFDETQVSVIAAGLVTGQSEGEGGILLNNGQAGLIYLTSCVVYVCRFTDRCECYVSQWSRVNRQWYSGDLVFSLAATDNQSLGVS